MCIAGGGPPVTYREIADWGTLTCLLYSAPSSSGTWSRLRVHACRRIQVSAHIRPAFSPRSPACHLRPVLSSSVIIPASRTRVCTQAISGMWDSRVRAAEISDLSRPVSGGVSPLESAAVSRPSGQVLAEQSTSPLPAKDARPMRSLHAISGGGGVSPSSRVFLVIPSPHHSPTPPPSSCPRPRRAFPQLSYAPPPQGYPPLHSRPATTTGPPLRLPCLTATTEKTRGWWGIHLDPTIIKSS